MTICRSCGDAMPKPGRFDAHICDRCWFAEVVSGPKNFAGVAESQTQGGGNGKSNDAVACESATVPTPSGVQLKGGVRDIELVADPLAGSTPAASTLPPSRSLTDVTKREDGQTVAPMDGRGGGFLEGVWR